VATTRSSTSEIDRITSEELDNRYDKIYLHPMKPILALATLAILFLGSVAKSQVLASQPQARQLVFRAGREGESLAWYLLNQRLIAPTPQQQNDRKLYQVTIEVNQRFYEEKPRIPNQPPDQGGALNWVTKNYQTTLWVNCSTQAPFVAGESPSKPGYLDVLYVNPSENSRVSGTRYYNLYWAACHDLWNADSVLWSGDPADATSLQMQSIRQLAEKLGYPSR